MPNRGGLSGLDLLIIGVMVVAVIAAIVMAVLWTRVLEQLRGAKLSQADLDRRAQSDRDAIRVEREAVVRREASGCDGASGRPVGCDWTTAQRRDGDVLRRYAYLRQPPGGRRRPRRRRAGVHPAIVGNSRCGSE